MIKIAILATARTGHGGTLLYTQSMLESLALLPLGQFSCTIYTHCDNHEFDGMGLPIVLLPKGPLGIMRAALEGRLFDDMDIILSPVYSGLLLLTRKPFIFTLHDLQEKYYPQYFSLLTRAWRELMNRILIKKARRVLCESEFVKRDITRFYHVSSHTIYVIPSPPISALFEDTGGGDHVALVRARYELPEQFLFYPAQFWPHKNHLRLVEAFHHISSAFPHCHLVLTGKARDEYDKVFRLVGALGLEGRVHHIGYVESADLVGLYQGATAVVIPTLFESISIPIYEAFALGAPVCASNVVALPEQIGEAGLLFDPTSVEDITARMTEILSSQLLRSHLADLGKQRILTLTRPAYASALQDLILKALDGEADSV